MQINIVSIFGVAVVSAILCVMLKKHNPEYSIVISIAAGVLIFGIVITQIYPAASKIKSIIAATNMSSEYGLILLKCLGICFITQFASDTCKDAGEGALSSKVELAGKITILLSSIPLFEKIMQTVLTLIKG